MFHQYLFTQRLAEALHQKISGARLAETFTQHKDELILGFVLPGGHPFYIRGTFQTDINQLSFPDNFQRARKNSVDQFSALLDKRVVRVSAVNYDRSFIVFFERECELLFKLHGNRSNVILLMDGKPREVFRSGLIRDHEIDPRKLAKSFDLETPDAAQIASFEKVLGKEVIAYLRGEGYDGLNTAEKSQKIRDIIERIKGNPITILTSGKPALTLLEPPGSAHQTHDPIEACNVLYAHLIGPYRLNREKDRLLTALTQEEKRTKSYLSKARDKARELANRRSYEEPANIIMANLHQIPPNADSVSLHDFYRDEEIQIKLRRGMTPQKNAEKYYQKSRNQRIELEVLERNIQSKENQLEEIRVKRERVAAAGDMKEVSRYIKQDTNELKERTPLPFRKFVFQGYDILIGKDGKSNDTLTLKHAKKDDLWLHARDVPGSHVVVKNPTGSTIPKPVIEQAASAAAFYSKSKTESVAAVIMTPKKYVRKKKGLPPGKVIVEKEEVILVPPSNPFD